MTTALVQAVGQLAVILGKFYSLSVAKFLD